MRLPSEKDHDKLIKQHLLESLLSVNERNTLLISPLIDWFLIIRRIAIHSYW